ncbi:MAG: toprim domain-containing protein [Candidatus Margulisbacteria bacterium]|nr:toprim domain-containing protein [Candidatus Margulisiibacteriota bacterium]MBU1022185.1 toprim domain-containing protein [Candidatus Margulisiibacteriota bacterium]MBU1729376.1 toprim domain-containing protein [Candidatus Margulisiibacteriota bacterium]MBU1955649.1 toprim domain-containing protein [Candidatus Margulisiibacteriota bacterium]
MSLETITIKEYLSKKGIIFIERGGELITQCLFNGCDNDSRGSERHLYFSANTGQYDCKKCGTSGNLITLAKHFGDDSKDIVLCPIKRPNHKKAKFNQDLVEKCHQALPEQIRRYLNARGITDAVIGVCKLGLGEFYGKSWITIPIKDNNGNFVFFKLRQDPNKGNDKMTYPKGVEAQIYDWEVLQNIEKMLVICEGELDRLLLISKGIPAISSTHGAMTFKQEWVEKIGKGRKIYICYDNDEAGRNGSRRVVDMLFETGNNDLYLITLPDEVGEGGDITDYFVKLKGSTEDLFGKYAKEYPEKIDTSQFKPLSTQKLIEILGLTIKKDEENKLITFLCELSAYTENSQLNISFNAPSSTGKSYIPTEIAQLFPEEDIIEVGYCSPTAFFHDAGKYEKEKEGYTVDLSRKILIFLDQPHTLLLQHLRPLLSHDKKEIRIKITDKSQKAGLRTKNIYLRGFPSVIFCTAGLKLDEQETTRFLLLSPETNREKIREAIYQKIRKEADSLTFQQFLENEPERKLLKERIRAIKQAKIRDIKISSPEKIEKAFFTVNKILKPRHQRDIGRILSLIKAFALLNLWFRERSGSTIIVNEDDINEAFKVWHIISESQEFNLPPYIYQIYQDIITPAWREKNLDRGNNTAEWLGLTRREVTQKHIQEYGRVLADWLLRMQIIPMLENAGLIMQERDPDDKRKMLVYPTTPLTISTQQNNSEQYGGVDINKEGNHE